MLGWLVDDECIEPHIPVFDKSERKDGAFPATDFAYDHEADQYTCPGGKPLKPCWRDIAKERSEFGKDGFKKYFARKQDCAAGTLKPRCTPNQPTRKIARSQHEGARQMARDIAKTDAYVASGYARKRSRCCSRTSSASLVSTASASEDRTAPETSSTSPPGPEPPQARQAGPRHGVNGITPKVAVSSIALSTHFFNGIGGKRSFAARLPNVRFEVSFGLATCRQLLFANALRRRVGSPEIFRSGYIASWSCRPNLSNRNIRARGRH